jgi:hypothetical protein
VEGIFLFNGKGLELGFIELLAIYELGGIIYRPSTIETRIDKHFTVLYYRRILQNRR